MALTKLSYQELQELIPIVLKSGEVPFIQGFPGIGKSNFWREIAEKFDLLLIDIRLTTLDPTMLNGFLWMDKNENRAEFKSLNLFPLQGDEIPINPKTGNPYKGFLIHFDEFTQIPKAIEGAAYRVILDREVGERKLHDRVFMACSGNTQGFGQISKPMSTPMRSRLIHFEMVNDAKKFITETIDKLDFHPLIPAFLADNHDYMNNFADNHSNIDGTYACERTWQKLSNILKAFKKDQNIEQRHLPLLVATVGEAAGNGFYAFTQSYYSSTPISDIVANPATARIPELRTERYAALAYLIQNCTLNNGAALDIYIRRFDEEFQVIFGKMLLKKNEEVFDQHFSWITDLVVKYALVA